MKSPYIAVAVKAARRAASEITRAATSLDTLEVENKSVNDFVTAADRAARKAPPIYAALKLAGAVESVVVKVVVDR